MTEEMIKFLMYVLGYDRETVLQIYRDWVKHE